MTEFLLIRHGLTDWNLEGRIQGHSDVPLNEIGLAQAEAFALSLAGQSFDLILSSDLKRGAQTAQIIASHLSVPIEYDPRLREVNHGSWEGMLISTVHTQFGREYTGFRSDPVLSRAPGGESLQEALGRILAVVEETSGRFPTGRIVIVSHGLILALLRCRIKGFPLDQAHQFGLENCAGDIVKWPIPSENQS